MEGEQEAALRSAASCHAVFYERDERPMRELYAMAGCSRLGIARE